MHTYSDLHRELQTLSRNTGLEFRIVIQSVWSRPNEITIVIYESENADDDVFTFDNRMRDEDDKSLEVHGLVFNFEGLINDLYNKVHRV